MPVTVYIGSDHAGWSLKRQLIEKIAAEGLTIMDCGPDTDASCDYPDYAGQVCRRVLEENGSIGLDENPRALGILICGTGIGMSMAANHISGIRAALCSCEFQARATRQHNNANVLCIGARVTGSDLAKEIVNVFLHTGFESGRHLRRIGKLESCLD
ncbi:MAG: ribose 5-phosphate isomerase B [Desulfovibrionaceae bacterium]|nr:ribose 5-phosphate isomerase B [Desulfovibrionaceae bacterium]